MKAAKNQKVISLVETKAESLYALRQEIKALSERERELTSSLVREIETAGLTSLSTPTLRASVMYSERLTVDPAAYRKRVSAADFIASVSVSVTEAKKHLGSDVLRSISTVTESTQLRLIANK